jgi:chemotaxis protein methyltransferase CheR
MMDLAPFRQLLERMCGLVFENEKSALLEARIRARMAARSISSTREYLSLLSTERHEFTELIDLLTINETYFYREPVHFALLGEKVVPELLTNAPRPDKIVILSAGCSTGEEAYSILISLLERYGLEMMGRFSVVGVDIDTSAVSRAREGVFGRRSFRGFPEKLLERYFAKAGSDVWRARDYLRGAVSFLPQNLLDREYPPQLTSAHVIFYRNVSIYFSRDVRNRIFERLAGILREGGYLFTSPSETFFYNNGGLELLSCDGAFLFRKGAVSGDPERRRPLRGERRALQPGKAGPFSIESSASVDSAGTQAMPRPRRFSSEPRSLAGIGGSIPDGSGRPAPSSLARAVEHADAGEYEKSLRMLDQAIIEAPGDLLVHTLKGYVLMRLKRLEEARSSYLEAQKIDRLCIDASFFLGLIERMLLNYHAASRSLREAIYIQPSCWPAHYFLAETHLDMGDTEHARREYGVILKILEKGDFLRHGLASLPFSFSRREMETLCRRKLQMLKKVSNGH